MSGAIANYHNATGMVLGLAALSVVLLLLPGCAPKGRADPEMNHFLKAREAQVGALVSQSNSKMPAEGWSLFDYLQRDDWSKATNAFAGLQRRSGRSATPVPPSPLQTVADSINRAGQSIGLPPPKASALKGAPWHAIVDAHWAYVVSKTWRREPLEFITGSIQRSIPPGAIFFGDSDVGRFAMCRALGLQNPDKQLWVITQNQLADYSYWEYAWFLYGTNLTMPSQDDFLTVYSRYAAGAYGTGTVAVAAMNAEFGQLIFHQNPGRRFYIEASCILSVREKLAGHH